MIRPQADRRFKRVVRRHVRCDPQLDRRQSHGKNDDGEAMSQVVERMIAVLEASALTVPEITSQSADLQSLVHEWQRQLQNPKSTGTA